MLKIVQSRLLAAALSISALGLFSESATADFLFHPWESHHEGPQAFSLDARLNYYSTNTNYLSDGTTATPTGLGSSSKIEPDLMLIYGVTDRLSVYARATWERVNLDAPASKYNGATYGFGDQSLGVDYQVVTRQSLASYHPSLDLQLEAQIPAYSNGSSDANIVTYLGDQTLDLTAGPHARIPITIGRSGALAALGSVGYTYRNNGFSSDIPWSVYVEYRSLQEGLFAKLGGFGIFSLKSDAFDPVKQLSSRPTTATGGSYIANAIDPSLANFNGLFGYSISSHLDFYGMGVFSFQGTSAPSGLTFAGGAIFHFGGGAHSDEDSAHLSPSAYGKSNRGFVNYGLTGKVLRSNDRLNLIKIDKGTQDGVEMGETFDIFSVKADGGPGEAIARAKVTDLKSNEAALTVSEYFKEIWIDEGFIAKRPIP